MAHNHNYVVLSNQSQTFYLLPVGLAAFHGIDPGGVHTGMTQNIRQPHNVLLCGIIGSGEKVAQIVGVNLLGRYLRL